MTVRPVAIVPARTPGGGLSRLASVLSPEERTALGGAMLADVVAALKGAPVERLVVAAASEEAATVARSLGVEVSLDPPGTKGLNTAVAAAVATLAARTPVLVVMADLPCLSRRDVTSLLEHSADVVVAANDDGGTGALLRRPANAIPTAYGLDSAGHHMALAKQAGLSVDLVRLPGFALDVDKADDLDRLRGWAGVGQHTAAVLGDLVGGVATRRWHGGAVAG